MSTPTEQDTRTDSLRSSAESLLRLAAEATRTAPTPWSGYEASPGSVYCDDVTGSRVAECHSTMTTRSIDEERANAQYIIACAPDRITELATAYLEILETSERLREEAGKDAARLAWYVEMTNPTTQNDKRNAVWDAWFDVHKPGGIVTIESLRAAIDRASSPTGAPDA